MQKLLTSIFILIVFDIFILTASTNPDIPSNYRAVMGYPLTENVPDPLVVSSSFECGPDQTLICYLIEKNPTGGLTFGPNESVDIFFNTLNPIGYVGLITTGPINFANPPSPSTFTITPTTLQFNNINDWLISSQGQ